MGGCLGGWVRTWLSAVVSALSLVCFLRITFARQYDTTALAPHLQYVLLYCCTVRARDVWVGGCSGGWVGTRLSPVMSVDGDYCCAAPTFFPTFVRPL